MLIDILERVNQSRKKALQNPHFVELAKRKQKDIQEGKLKYRQDES